MIDIEKCEDIFDVAGKMKIVTLYGPEQMKSFFKKKEKQTLETKFKKTKVRTVGTRKKLVIVY
ncbi:hypothetical protein [Pseudogracilibacillus auburnensis]|uniref:hypothetical protein n=1 Tax=Pseudogracilibacillus auburnensis TaxID=1494959 RepID=UPI00355777E9